MTEARARPLRGRVRGFGSHGRLVRRNKAMVQCALAIIKVMAVVGASRIATVDRADTRPWARIWVEGWKLLRIIVVQTAAVAACGPLERGFILPVTFSGLCQSDVQAC